VTSGGAGLSQVPIIDDRSYLDDAGNFHASVYSFTTRARLTRDNGHADNYIIRRHGSEVSLADENLALMDQWLANIQADDSELKPLEKIVHARPSELQDDCWTEAGERIVEKAVFDRGPSLRQHARRLQRNLPAPRGPPPRRGWAFEQRRIQVPVEADRLQRVRNRVHGRRKDTLGGNLRSGCVRLVPTRRTSSGKSDLAVLRTVPRKSLPTMTV